MTERFTHRWLQEMDRAAGAASSPQELQLVIQQVVTEGDEKETAYAIRLDSGTVSVVSGRADDADVTFTQDRATADAIASGALSAQAAFMAGRLRVGGDLRSVLDRARGVQELEDLFAPVRQAEGAGERDA